MIYNDPMLWPKKETVPVGTVWTITEDGDWEVLATGNYQVELHGGGGGAGGGLNVNYGETYWSGGAGGGSGELFNASLTKGEIISAQIGQGGSGGNAGSSFSQGTDGNAGSKTSFGDFFVNGGDYGRAPKTSGNILSQYPYGGAASGSIATAGSSGSTYANAVGGYGNKNNQSQRYGNGGSGKQNGAGESGQPGAAIITYLGKG